MAFLDVLFEDNHVLVVNKPAGLLVHGDETGDITLADLAKEYIKEKYGKPGNVFIGVVHRLDRPVSGVVLMAKTSKALARLNELFRSKKTRKIYWAIVLNRPQQESGTLVHWLVKDSSKNVTKAFAKENAAGQRSELNYKLLGDHQGKYLLEVNPITGRPHQIRVQLASMRCPIVGDLKYGAAQPLPDKSIALHARQLEFEHPTLKTTITVSAPLPATATWKPFA
ncbi:RluA family pseudouridine synthase [Pontibacter sp. BT310]|uniref:RluA family pseudouridine synthase n=1 Tax=Pontibacter populi TaxID=890055 RepID=A0ABS6X9V5_9BACT|nr:MULTISPECIES: RluA family pseudouridine synthase [Pontibacter]MBJ6117038.1 RluA family pseudouridine synthase [Pontibacter sp. BT310]MBR0569462.1 RluA family pseudouridine synthase [Microvirga sp. STS03]MBW3363891.1 RluA family pseudouridine synthase [Pontibacter populi]